jgi:hypothetical protein
MADAKPELTVVSTAAVGATNELAHKSGEATEAGDQGPTAKPRDDAEPASAAPRQPAAEPQDDRQSVKLRDMAATEPIHKRVLAFIKEWGGVATVIIAVAYTFPFEIFDRYIRWEEYSVVESRKALSDASSLVADEIMNSAKITDWQTKQLLQSTYSSRITNILVNNFPTFAKAQSKLRYSELYILGSMLSLNGFVKEALPYYEAAILKAKIQYPSALPTIYREKGNALFLNTPYENIDEARKNIDEARKSYQNALALLDLSKMKDQATYLWMLTELGSQELIQGDWQCGRDILSSTLDGVKSLSAVDQTFTGIYQVAERQFATTNKRAAQPAKGCKGEYKIPELDLPYSVPDPALVIPSGSVSDALNRQDVNSIFNSIPLSLPSASDTDSKVGTPGAGPLPTPH